MFTGKKRALASFFKKWKHEKKQLNKNSSTRETRGSIHSVGWAWVTVEIKEEQESYESDLPDPGRHIESYSKLVGLFAVMATDKNQWGSDGARTDKKKKRWQLVRGFLCLWI